MGFAAGENPLSYPEIKYDTVRSLVAADTVVRILTPDLKGVNYLKAHQPLLIDARFKYHEHLTLAGMARPFHALDEMGHLLGGFDGLLPYGKEIDRCATEEMLTFLTACIQSNSERNSAYQKLFSTLSDIPMRQISTGCCIEQHKIQSVFCTTSIWGFREFEKSL